MGFEESAKEFYTAFAKRDAQNMVKFYHQECVFNDEAFVNLTCAETKAMWTMLCANAKNFELTFQIKEAINDKVCVYWEASYDFSKTGRRVVNRITTVMEFKDGLILRQKDSFSFYAWARQALGPIGVVLGWTTFLKCKVQKEARSTLLKYMSKN